MRAFLSVLLIPSLLFANTDTLSPPPFDSDLMVAGLWGTELIEQRGGLAYDGKLETIEGYEYISSKKIDVRAVTIEIKHGFETAIYYVEENKKGEIEDIRLVLKNKPLPYKIPGSTVFRIIAQAVKNNYSYGVLRWRELNKKHLQEYQRKRNKTKDFNKRESYRKDFHYLSNEDGGGMEVYDSAETPDKELETNEVFTYVYGCVKHMDPVSKQIAELILDGVKDENIAAALSVDIEEVLDIRGILQHLMKLAGMIE